MVLKKKPRQLRTDNITGANPKHTHGIGIWGNESQLTSSEEVNLEKSGKFLQLYPVLKSKNGDVIDGKHRLQANPAWKTQVLPEIDTKEKVIIARAMSNWHRRQVSAEEKSEYVNSLGEIYRNEGFATGAVAKRVAEALGCSETTARFHLSDEYKQTSKARTGERDEARVPASQVIESKFGDYGKQLVTRHEAEVKQKLLESPEFEAEFKQMQEERIHKMNLESQKRLQEQGFPPLNQQIKAYFEKVGNMQPKKEPNGTTKEDYIYSIKSAISKHALSCKVCGNNELQWSCGHELTASAAAEASL